MKDKIRSQVQSILTTQAIHGQCKIQLNGKIASINTTLPECEIEGNPVLIAECVRLLKKEQNNSINKFNTANYLRTEGRR